MASILKHLKKEGLIEKIEKHQEDLSKGRRFSGNLFEAGTMISALIIGILALFFMIINFRKITGIKGVRINAAKWLKYAIYIAILFIIGTILGESNDNTIWLNLFSIILVGVIFLVHTYIIIPKIALRKKYRYYGALALLIYLLLIAFLYL